MKAVPLTVSGRKGGKNLYNKNHKTWMKEIAQGKKS